MKVLYLVPGMESDGATAQLAVLARGLARRGHEVRVCSLGALPAVFRHRPTANLRTVALGWTRCFDPRPLFCLRRLMNEFRPDVIHACHRLCLRALVVSVGRSACRMVLSHPFPTLHRRARQPSRLDRWLLGRVDAIVAATSAEASRCLRAGVSIGRVVVIPPGIEPIPVSASAAELPGGRGARRVLCAGCLEQHKGYREAVWATEILCHLDRDLRLVLAGEGPERRRLEECLREVLLRARVDLLGTRDDVPALMTAAEVVWVPSLTDGGARVALEGMAAGLPVVTSRQPGLAEIVRDGESGLLVPPGDKVALARATLRLLEDDKLRKDLGEAGRRRAASHYSAEQAVQVAADLYNRLAA